MSRLGSIRVIAVLLAIAVWPAPAALDAQTMPAESMPGDDSLPTIVSDDERMTVELPDGVSASLKDLQWPSESLVIGIIRGTHALVPHGDDTVEPRDHLLVLCTEEARLQVQSLF